MKTVSLQLLHQETKDTRMSHGIPSYQLLNPKKYSLEGINSFLYAVSNQKDCALYFPIYCYITVDSCMFEAYIVKPINIIKK